ncbi:MAG TPA: hypothetical protein VK470_17870 [Bacteroidota bacterium]|nr:hypothetical protein [Bacteroidota bacterium]
MALPFFHLTQAQGYGLNSSIWNGKFPAWFVVAMAMWFFIFSLEGCTTTGQISQPSTQAPPVPSRQFYSLPSKSVFRSIEKVAYNRGYIVTMRDEAAGALTAEQYTTTPVEEDRNEVKPTGPSAGDVIITILGIICLVGIIVVIARILSSSNTSSNNTEYHHDNAREEYYDSREEQHTVGYRYVMNFRTTALTDTTSQVDVTISKVVIENGTPTSSAPINSSALRKGFFEALENELAFVQ